MKSNAFLLAAKYILVVAAVMLFTAVASRAENIRNRFGNWSVDCDDGLFCRLIAREVGDAADPGLFAFPIARHEGWRIWITQSSGRPDLSLGIQVVVHETPFFFPEKSIALKVDGTGSRVRHEMYLLGGDAERLLKVLGPGTFANVDFTDCGGAEHTLTFAQSGFAAALAWMRHYQGGGPVSRIIGTADATSVNCGDA